MKISVMLHTGHFRGDHEADIVEAHEVRPGETVEELVARFLSEHRAAVDKIELRRVISVPSAGGGSGS